MVGLSSLRRRFFTAIILIILILIALFIKPLLLIVILIYMIFTANEYFRLWHRKDIYPHTLITYLPSLLIPVLVYFNIDLTVPFFLFFCFVLIISVLRYPGSRQQPNFLIEIAAAVFGIIYLSLMPSTLILLRKISIQLAILPLILCWAYDTFAYIIGTLIGRWQLASEISPKKTWEGTIIAIVLLFPIAFVLGNIWIDNWRLLDGIIITLGIGVLGTIGDLLESGMKREVNLKDSSRIFPGHGGFLDRVDSLMLNVPFFYFYILFRVHL